MILRFSGEITTLVFAILGYIINRQLNKIPCQTEYEKSIRPKQKQALRTMWITIVSFLIISVLLCVYDVIGFKSAQCRVIIPEIQWLNDLVWFIMRSAGYQIWAIPVIIVFWPQKRRSRGPSSAGALTEPNQEALKTQGGDRDTMDYSEKDIFEKLLKSTSEVEG
jgi:hypothetical protein